MSKVKKKPRRIFLHLDRFQQMKQERMRCLLEELEQNGETNLNEFLSRISIDYGIRRNTGKEYIQDWLDAGCISIQGNKIKFLRKPKGWE
jgi:hypothetical protein